MANFTLTQNVQVIKQFEEVTTDGSVYMDPGPPVVYGFGTNLQLLAMTLTDWQYRGYIEWDISTFKHVQSIDSLYLIGDFYYSNGSDSIIGIRSGQPSAGSAQNIYGWIGSGTTYVSGVFPANSDTRYWIKDLGATARGHLLTDIGAGTTYFALGLAIHDENYLTTTDELVLWGSGHNYSEPKHSILWVKYTVNNIVTITQPEIVDRGHPRNVEYHLFKSGGFSKKDIGGQGRAIKMRGKEWDSGSATSMSYIDDMAELGEAVTISGFTDTTLNGVWLIENFSWVKRGGYDDVHYDWELSLLKSSG